MQFQTIPLSKLVPSPENVRKTNTKDGIEGLATNIKAHGLLSNLIVRATDGGKFEVVAGGRRLAALKHLAKTEKQDEDNPQIPCSVIEGDEDAHEISLSENELRSAMRPADQFEAFRKLADEGQGNDTIAAKFGVTPRVVEQRLKLAVVSPKLIKAYRDDEMTLEHLMALTLTDDHKGSPHDLFKIVR
jgi:ParB family transcriptional regulator, chromosome partitioning protein